MRSPLLAICCGLFGYIIGSMPSATNDNLQGRVDVKFRHRPFEYDTDMPMKEMMKEIDVDDHELFGVNKSSIDESWVYMPTKKSIIEEIVPPKLLPVYEILQFNVTRSMLRQSRPVIGNTQRLHSYLKKLRNKECTTVLFLGGSGEFDHIYAYTMPIDGT
jgi:hypothetical protein